MTFLCGLLRAALAADAVIRLPDTGPGCDMVRLRPCMSSELDPLPIDAFWT